MCGCARPSPTPSTGGPMIEYLWRGAGATGAQRSSPAKLGLQRKRADLRPRSRQGARAARCGRLSSGQRRALSPHHEDFHYREYTLDGRRHAAAVARGGDRARHSQLRVGDVFRRRDSRSVSALQAALGRGQRGSGHLLRFSLLQVSAEWRTTAATTRIRKWMR